MGPPKPAEPEDLHKLQATHADLCAEILREEEALLEGHRRSIEAQMGAIKREMSLLRRVESLQCSVDDFVEELSQLLTIKSDEISKLQGLLTSFREHLKQEEQLSSTIRR